MVAMKSQFQIWTISLCPLLPAHTVVITSLPDASRPLETLSSSDTLPLSLASEIKVGAFPGLSASDLVDAAASGGLANIENAFEQFGNTFNMGTGADANPGTFEIVVRETTTDAAVSWNQESIALLITSAATGEFMVAWFPTELFEVDSPTGLETTNSLHLADAQLVLGQNLAPFSFSSAPAPTRPSFDTWIAQFTSITDPSQRTLYADPDGDNRSNFLEYATGGNPAAPDLFAPTRIVFDTNDNAWFRVSVSAGLGLNRFQVESTANTMNSWLPVGDSPILDPSPPVPDSSIIWLRYPMPADQVSGEFFRLKVTPGN